MSIPKRFYRIAKHKLEGVREWVERMDDEAQREEEARARRDPRSDAQRELEDTLSGVSPPPAGGRPNLPSQAPPPSRRTPEEIARGLRSAAPPPPTLTAPPAAPSGAQPPDPLTAHYRLLGVEVGSDFNTVHAAYNKFAARSDPSRFPAGSDEEKQAQQIRARLEESYRILRDALDPTARRFDLLEFETPQPPTPPAGNKSDQS